MFQGLINYISKDKFKLLIKFLKQFIFSIVIK